MAELVSTLRRPADPDPSDEALTLDGRYAVSEELIGTAEGSTELPLLICRPVGIDEPGPALLVLHGGGMCCGTNRSGLVDVLQIAAGLDLVVLSLGYRLAPENPDPIPLEDCYRGLLTVVNDAHRLGVDPRRIVLWGTSGGGGLAAGAALRTRDDRGPRLAGLMLLSPMLDDRNNSFSAHQMEGLDTWTRQANGFAWSALLGDRAGGVDVTSYSAPARATDLSGLPPTFLDVGSTETFRDEVTAFADRLWRSGGSAELHVWPGGYHGFESVTPQSRLAQLTWQSRLHWLQRVLDL